MKNNKSGETDKLLSKMTNRLIKTEKELDDLKKQNSALLKDLEDFKGMKEEHQLMKAFLVDNAEWIKENNDKLSHIEQIRPIINSTAVISTDAKEHVATNKESYKPLKKQVANIDLGTLAKKIGELNHLLESTKGGKVIKHDGNFAYISEIERIKFTLYRNGILIEGYDFFDYGARQTAEIVVDIIEGYFPSIFEQRFPNGVYLTLVDELDSSYSEFENNAKAKLIQKVPKQVLKNGELINVREKVEGEFSQGEPNLADKKTDFKDFSKTIGMNLMNTLKEAIESNDEPTEEWEPCKLKIRTPTNKFIYLDCKSSHTFQDLYNKLGTITKQRFEIFYSYPFKKIPYEENTQMTLKELNMVPSCLLVLKSI